MEIVQAALVLVDISGYTKFITRHKASLLHAERIITELMESVIDSSTHPLILNKLEGDAALFYAAGKDGEALAQDVRMQVFRFFDDFKRKRAELTTYNVCPCEACTGIDKLQLKMVLHHGEVAIKQVRQFEELAGESVIVAHRLLKNSIPSHQYVLMTEAFHKLCPPLRNMQMERRTEHCEGVGEVEVVVYYPDHALPAESLPPVHGMEAQGRRASQLARVMGHHLLRLLGLRRGVAFAGLAGL